MKILGIGDNVVDFYKDLNIMFPGGNALNVEVFRKKYNAEKSSYIGVIGNDKAGNHVLKSLEKEGVDASKIRKAYGQNGEAVVELNEENDRVFVSSNKNRSIQSQLKINFNEEDISFIKEHTLVHTSVYSFIENDLPLLNKTIDISFDFSTNLNEDYLRKVCPFIKFGFFSGSNLTEQETVTLIDKAHSLGVENICITKGEKGAIFSSDKVYNQSAVAVETVDTLGAGDSFIARFLVEYYKGLEISQILKLAAESAAETCTYFGAFGNGIKK